MPEELPSAVTAACPDCGEETIHSVLHGRAGRSGNQITLDATVQCEDCSRVHHVLLREAAPLELPVVVSKGQESRRTSVQLAGDDEVHVGDLLIVEGMNAKLTGIEDKDGRRVDAAAVKDVKTLWTKEFEELAVRFAINMGKKTITKVLAAAPEEEFTVGQEMLFNRLRVTIHAIKTEERLVKRGTAEAGEIVRVFASPTPISGPKNRPEKAVREQMRLAQERAGQDPRRGRRDQE